MGRKPLPWPTYPVVHPLTKLPCGCVAYRCRYIDGIGREFPREVVDFNVVTHVATVVSVDDEGRYIVVRKADGTESLSYDTTHGARLFCAHGEVRAVEQERP